MLSSELNQADRPRIAATPYDAHGWTLPKLVLSGLRILITGSAGFIGFHVAKRLLAEGAQILGIDNFSPYYDPGLKERRNAILEHSPGFTLLRIDICDAGTLKGAFVQFEPDIVVHLAAQAGVRHSLKDPASYVQSNVVGTLNLLECCREQHVVHLLIASTSSVYGASPETPFRETSRTASPLSLYAATKSAAEQMAHAYSHLFDIPTTCFRFFTVYGPWGRPDMALYKFADAMLTGRAVDVFNAGDMTRDFTFVDDLVEAVIRLMGLPPDNSTPSGAEWPAPKYRIVNIGGGKPERLSDYIAALEDALGVRATKNLMPMQMGDVPTTHASADLLRELTGYVPATSIKDGVSAFVEWFREYAASG